MEPLRHIYNDPSIAKDLITTGEFEYLKHLIRKENENAQRANGCTH